ncbi:MAG: hypothetical protein LIO41_06935 [Ruminococcus sp.]|nr:hypothetical protein [Ruminococcus sp.]
MYTSDTDRKRAAKTSLIYLIISLVCVLFGAVYEYFSHEVYSYYMLYAFMIPLVGGTLVYLYIFLSRLPVPKKASFNLYNSGIAALCVGCIFNGVLEIYGTTNSLISVYWLAGVILVFLGVIVYLFEIRGSIEKATQEK